MDIQYKDGRVISYTAATSEGMSLRDYFAAQALIGLVSMGGIRAIVAEKGLHVAGAQVVLAEGAYQVADAMLKARDAK